MTKERKMARRKKKESAVKTDVSNELCLTGEQLKTIDLNEARVQMQHVVLENLELKAQALSIEYRNQMEMIKAKKRATNKSLQSIQQEHNEFIAGIEAGLGIVLKDYSIEVDGNLTYNPLPEKPPEKPQEE